MSDIKPDLLRIRSNPTHDKRAKGQDTVVEVVHPDGTAVPLPNVQAVYFYVDGRRDYATAVIVAHVRADITAPRGDSSLMMEMAKLAGEMAAKDALIADLKLQLQDSLGVELTGAD